MIGTAEYNLGKYLIKILKMQCQPLMLYSTGSFVNQISSFDSKPHVLVSYDVDSLFTNIPLNETIDIVYNYVF